MRTKLMTILLSIVMVVTMMPMMAFAEAADTEAPVVAQNEEQTEEPVQGEPEVAPEEEILSWDITADSSKTYGTITATLLEDTREVIEDGEVTRTEQIGWVLSISGKIHDTISVEKRSGIKLLMRDFTEQNSSPWKDEASEINSVILNGNIYNIGAFAFANCSKLNKILQITQIESIGESAFAGCTNLESFIIPKAVTQIGNNAFNNCANLKTVTIKPKTTQTDSGIVVDDNQDLPTVGTGAFRADTKIIVARELYKKYSDDSSWENYAINMLYNVTRAKNIVGGVVYVNSIGATTGELLDGETVKLLVKANKGYALADESLKCTYGNDSGDSVDVKLTEPRSEKIGGVEYAQYTFTMPNADVTYTATFELTEDVEPVEPSKPSVIEKFFDNIGDTFREAVMRTANIAVRIIEPVYKIVVQTSQAVSKISKGAVETIAKIIKWIF